MTTCWQSRKSANPRNRLGNFPVGRRGRSKSSATIFVMEKAVPQPKIGKKKGAVLPPSPSGIKKKEKASKSKEKTSPKKKDDSDDSQIFELDEKNLFICLNQTRKVIPMPRQRTPKSEDAIGKCSVRFVNRVVVILRDFSIRSKEEQEDKDKTKNACAKLLMARLQDLKVKSYIIPIPSLLEDLQAINIMKDCAANHPQLEQETAYQRLMLAIIENKIENKVGHAVICDLQDKTDVCHLQLKSFCETVCSAEVFTLDKNNSASFDLKLEKLVKKVYLQMSCPNPQPAMKLLNSRILPFPSTTATEKEISTLWDVIDQDCHKLKEKGSDLMSVFASDESLAGSPSPPGECSDEEESADNNDNNLLQKQSDSPVEVKEQNRPTTSNKDRDNLLTTIIDINTGREYLPGSSLAAARNELVGPHEDSNGNVESSNYSESEHCAHNTKGESDTSVKDGDEDPDLQKSVEKRAWRHKRTKKKPSAATPLTPGKSGTMFKSESEESLNMSLLFAQKPKLLEIKVTSDDMSRVPSAIIKEYSIVNGNNDVPLTPNGSLYKGWIAVPRVDTNANPSSSGTGRIIAAVQESGHKIKSKLTPGLRKMGQLAKRACRPVQNIFGCGCKSRRENNQRRDRAQRNDYPAIMMRSDAFDQKD